MLWQTERRSHRESHVRKMRQMHCQDTSQLNTFPVLLSSERVLQRKMVPGPTTAEGWLWYQRAGSWLAHYLDRYTPASWGSAQHSAVLSVYVSVHFKNYQVLIPFRLQPAKLTSHRSHSKHSSQDQYADYHWMKNLPADPLVKQSIQQRLGICQSGQCLQAVPVNVVSPFPVNTPNMLCSGGEGTKRWVWNQGVMWNRIRAAIYLC